MCSTGSIMTQASAKNTPAPRASKKELLVAVTADVEEEGLFSGRYSADCAVRNVALLPRLAPLTRELGFPLTLLCTHAVLTNPESRVTLARMRDSLGAEIGAHLHHWSTPPFGPEASPPVPTDKLPTELFRTRLRALLRAGQDFQGTPLRSFRMGRWDLKAALRPLLAEEGIRVDSSVCPLRVFPNGPDHFTAPSDPYWTDPGHTLLEAPVTQIPLFPWTAGAFYATTRALPGGDAFADNFHFWGALSANPLWHCSTLMYLAARLHVERGGRALCLFWHSSEMMPGASPHVRTERDADRLFARIYDFLRRLKEDFAVRPVTLSALPDAPEARNFAERGAAPGDW